MHIDPSRKPVALFIMGPTASGKTQLAIELSHHLPVQLISVDSAQVYKGLNIGSGKPDPKTLQQYPHELIDILTPQQPYNAQWFVADANRLIQEAWQKERLPVLVGGTMMYFKALVDGLAELPSTSPQLRLQLGAEGAKLGWPAMHERLSRIDPATAARLEPNDAQRIQRALEIFESCGQPMSELLKQQKSIDLAFHPINLALTCQDEQRFRLHQTIENRFLSMIQQGLVAEVEDLMKQEQFNEDLPAFRAVGYRQVIDFLKNESSHEEMVEKGVAATRQLAKRQLTWIRQWQNCTKLDCFDKNLQAAAIEQIKNKL